MLKPDDVFRRFFCGLSRERQQKIEQIKPEAERARSLMAGMLLDYGLWRLCGLRERAVALAFGAQGKPYARDYPDIHFNLSHSGGYALAAFAPVPVGCDIQKKGETKREAQIAGRFFSEGEQRAMEAGAGFYQIWARKESYLKLSGEGMALDMRSFCVTDEACGCRADASAQSRAADGEWGRTVAAGKGAKPRGECDGSPDGPCRFSDMELPDYCLSVCYAGAEFSVTWQEVCPADFWDMDDAAQRPHTGGFEQNGGE